MNELIASSKQLVHNVKTSYDNFGRRAHITIVSGIGLIVGGTSGLANAGLTAGDIGNNLGDQTVGMSSGALRLFGFVGLCFVGIALMKGRDAKKQGESVGTYVGMGIVGAVLLSISAIITMVNLSLLGTDASQTIQGQIIQ